MKPTSPLIDAHTRHVIVVVGQTPPPYHGQAIMIDKMLNGRYSKVELHHVPMRFSDSTDQVGRFRWRKIPHLLRLFVDLGRAKLKTRANILYYPPASPNILPLVRDLAVLIIARRLFRKTIFHFHAAGISEVYERLHPIVRPLFRMAYFHANSGIRVATHVPDDPLKLKARRDFTVPYGLDDEAKDSWRNRAWTDPPKILYVGTITESKGVLDLLSASDQLAKQGVSFELELVGPFESKDFQTRVSRFIGSNELGPFVKCRGLLLGEDKHKAFVEAHIFCFPSYYPAEACPVVLIEAMQFALPIVATAWRGIPDLVVDGMNGFLVPTRDPTSLADRLAILAANPHVAFEMGVEGRRIYESKYTLTRFLHELDEVFTVVSGDSWRSESTKRSNFRS